MAVKRAFKSSLRRLQCAIGKLLPRANHNQIYVKIYKLPTFGDLIYSWVAVFEKPILFYVTSSYFWVCLEKKKREKNFAMFYHSRKSKGWKQRLSVKICSEKFSESRRNQINLWGISKATFLLAQPRPDAIISSWACLVTLWWNNEYLGDDNGFKCYSNWMLLWKPQIFRNSVQLGWKEIIV